MTMRAIVTFKRSQGVTDHLGGGGTRNFQPIADLVRIHAEFKPERGQERIEAGRLESSVAGTLRVRSSAALRGVHAGDIVTLHQVDGDADHVIHAAINPDQRNRFIEFTIERGVALK